MALHAPEPFPCNTPQTPTRAVNLNAIGALATSRARRVKVGTCLEDGTWGMLCPMRSRHLDHDARRSAKSRLSLRVHAGGRLIWREGFCGMTAPAVHKLKLSHARRDSDWLRPRSRASYKCRFVGLLPVLADRDCPPSAHGLQSLGCGHLESGLPPELRLPFHRRRCTLEHP